MTTIGSIGGPAAPNTFTSTTAATDTGDALAPMRGALDTAFAVGRPTNRTEAAAILDTGDEFLAGAHQSLAKLDGQMQQRRDRLTSGTSTPAQQAEDSEQLQLMQVLRDRIQQSVDHVTRLFAGPGEDDAARRAALLAPTDRHAAATTGIAPALVAGAYARTADAGVGASR